MIIGLIQLSDIHIREANDWILREAQAIVGAAKAAEPSTTAYILLFSGDIAFSGKSEQYSIAKQFISSLKMAFAGLRSCPEVYSTFIPGNHDCDFARNNDARQLAVDNMRSRIYSLDLSGSIAEQCLTVLDNYYEFVAAQTGTPQPRHERRFADYWDLDINGFKIRINLLNTAWMSSQQEVQGQLLYPVKQVEALLSNGNQVDMVVTMLHHPYNWFLADNSRELRDLVESYSDVILTGHEHQSALYFKVSPDQNVLCFEGPVLQGDTTGKSGFTTLHVDTDSKMIRATTFQRQSGMYGIEREVAWQPLPKNKALLAGGLENTADFKQTLQDLGVGFTHPRSKSVPSLDQLFIYPEMRRRSTLKKNPSSTIEGKNVLEAMYDDKTVLISGPGLSGRTTLAKALYRDFRNKYDLLPILLQGNSLKSLDHGEPRRVLDEAIKRQYGPNATERYHQLSSSRKVLMIDDLDRSGFNAKGQELLLGALGPDFDFVVLFIDEFSALTTVGMDDQIPSLLKFEPYEIREFGFYLRAKLIEKWLVLGREHLTDEVKFNLEVGEYERLVNGVLGRNLLPSNPITILSVLQAAESTKTHDSTAGSYGYLYETLILHALSTAFKQPEVDVTMTFLGTVAYQMLKDDVDTLDTNQVAELEHSYFKEYRVPVPENLRLRLSDVRLLENRDGRSGFRYPYCLYFFAARHLRDERQSEHRDEIMALVREMADKVHYERYANTLTFYVYLSKDVETIRTILNNAKAVLAEFEPCDFESHVDFVNQLYKGKVAPATLPRTSASENRDEYRRKLDAEDNSEEAVAEMDAEESRFKYNNDLALPIKVNIAAKYLQILGQIVRNSPGSLKAGPKTEVATEAYLLGLRMISALLRVPKDNYAEMHEHFKEAIKEYRVTHRKPELIASSLNKLADESIIRLSEALGFSLIRRVSQSIGLRELRAIYSDILGTYRNKMAVRLINLSIKFDHFEDVSEQEITEVKLLEKELRHNFYSHNVLRDLIVTYLYLRDVPQKKRNSLMSPFKIQLDERKILLNPQRKKFQ